jgi:hypothetical protein
MPRQKEEVSKLEKEAEVHIRNPLFYDLDIKKIRRYLKSIDFYTP